jgi:hypothetical protein
MSFSPPPTPSDGQEYSYGNLKWQFSASTGTWNIVDGSVVGGQGPEGPAGPAGPAGPTGATGSGSSPLAGATSGVTGIASFNPNRFQVSVTGNVDLLAAYQVTGDTVQAGSAINIGAGKTINNIGVTAFNGLTGSVSLTGDGGAVQGRGNAFITARLASASVTGVASFNDVQFTLGTTGHVNIKFSGIHGLTGVRHGIPFFSPEYESTQRMGLTSSNTFLYNGNSLTFGSNNSTFTVTGPSIVFGAATEIAGGIFKNPAEAAPIFTLGQGVNTLVVNGTSGSIQRFSVNPSEHMTISTGSSWSNFATGTETIAVIVQNKNNITGQFDSSILTNDSTPILFGNSTSGSKGVTGGITIFTIMRINKGSGSGGLTMGFVISTGMTGGNFNIN